MTLVEQLRKIAAEQAGLSAGERDLELTEFYREMLRLGIAKKKVYEFPHLDTTGRSLHRKRVRGQA